MNEIADILVIGSGIAGLTLAVKAAERYPEKRIIVSTKSEVAESNTRYAQGGIAAVWNNDTDDQEKHIRDTLRAGDFINDRKIVELVVKEAPRLLRELIEWGADFDKNGSGDYDLALEGGHSEKRILHYKDITGYEIERALIEKISQKKNVQLLPHHFAVDLLTTGEGNAQRCAGAILVNLDNHEWIAVQASFTILATGGIGQVYSSTTNPVIATGDGIAMAARAGVKLRDMEFIQFHPTALYSPGQNPTFLISEAVRGLGAVLKNRQGIEFMKFYSRLGSLAPRDIVSRAIAYELEDAPFVYLDCTHIGERNFRDHFPNIYNKCCQQDIDPMHELIPVVPAAHYLCGGIATNEWGETSLPDLYACGECACTGLHGANRLASNSLSEALVFAHRIFAHIVNKYDNNSPTRSLLPLSDYLIPVTFTTNEEEADHLKSDINKIMSRCLGIVRSTRRMEEARAELHEIEQCIAAAMRRGAFHWKLMETLNILQVAQLITDASLARQENKGAFFSDDLHKKAMVYCYID